jgi:peptidyl-prolyl cis-trans isomerase C
MPIAFPGLQRTLSLLAGAAILAFGCTRSNQGTAPNPSAVASASPPARGLSADDTKIVLAKVGDVSITLGDYAAALDRMDRFERLRYQSADRRQQLLDELVNVELLAQEAKRQKLDEDPEVRLRLDEALRDEVLRDVHSHVATPESLPTAEVRAYYEAHRKEFKEPERRRVAAIVVTDEAKAKLLVDQAKAGDPAGWGELVRRHSIAREPNHQTPLELEGDLGIVSASGQPQGTGPKLSDAVLKALFEIPNVGDTYPRPVGDGQRYYVLRMTGRTEARERSFSEAERSIRVRMVEQRILAAEQQLVEALKQEYSVTIDENALSRVHVAATHQRENLKDALDH